MNKVNLTSYDISILKIVQYTTVNLHYKKTD